MGIDLIIMVINAALGSLSASGKIPQSISSIVASFGPIISNVVTSLQSGQGKTADVVTALGALSGVLAILKAQTTLDPEVLNQINVYDQAVQAGIAGYLDSKNGVDLSKLGPVAPIA